MKKILLYISFLITGISSIHAQVNEQRQEKIQALYVAYITRQINLTEDEAQRFWPVHAQFDAELNSVNANPNELERQQAALNVRKKYQDKFVKILGVERTNNFFKTDAGFRDKMIEALQKRRQQNNSNRPRGMLRNKNLMGY